MARPINPLLREFVHGTLARGAAQRNYLLHLLFQSTVLFVWWPKDSLADALTAGQAPATLVAVPNDRLVPWAQLTALANAIAGPCRCAHRRHQPIEGMSRNLPRADARPAREVGQLTDRVDRRARDHGSSAAAQRG